MSGLPESSGEGTDVCGVGWLVGMRPLFHRWNSEPSVEFLRHGLEGVAGVDQRPDLPRPLPRSRGPACSTAVAWRILMALRWQQETAVDPAVQGGPPDAQDLEELLGGHVGRASGGRAGHRARLYQRAVAPCMLPRHSRARDAGNPAGPGWLVGKRARPRVHLGRSQGAGEPVMPTARKAVIRIVAGDANEGGTERRTNSRASFLPCCS